MAIQNGDMNYQVDQNVNLSNQTVKESLLKKKLPSISILNENIIDDADKLTELFERLTCDNQDILEQLYQILGEDKYLEKVLIFDQDKYEDGSIVEYWEKLLKESKEKLKLD